jgi:hypothetical protein
VIRILNVHKIKELPGFYSQGVPSILGCLLYAIFQCSLRGSQTGNGNAVGGTGNVVVTDPVTELDGGWVSTMFTTNSHLKVQTF